VQDAWQVSPSLAPFAETRLRLSLFEGPFKDHVCHNRCIPVAKDAFNFNLDKLMLVMIGAGIPKTKVWTISSQLSTLALKPHDVACEGGREITGWMDCFLNWTSI